MLPEESPDSDRKTPAPWFTTTHWSVVLAAGASSSGPADEALAYLCNTYWKPLYNYVRRRGYPLHDAQDLTQEFFARLLAKDFLRGVDRNKGKFRSYLLGAMEHFLAKEWRHDNAQKRGGGCTFIPMDAAATESQYLQLPVDHVTPAQLYDQQWSITLQQLALNRLKDEHAASGKLAQYEATFHLLTRERQSETYAELAQKLGTTEAALKMVVKRMRERWLVLLREEVAKTVNTPEEADEELLAILTAWN